MIIPGLNKKDRFLYQLLHVDLVACYSDMRIRRCVRNKTLLGLYHGLDFSKVGQQINSISITNHFGYQLPHHSLPKMDILSNLAVTSFLFRSLDLKSLALASSQEKDLSSHMMMYQAPRQHFVEHATSCTMISLGFYANCDPALVYLE